MLLFFRFAFLRSKTTSSSILLIHWHLTNSKWSILMKENLCVKTWGISDEKQVIIKFCQYFSMEKIHKTFSIKIYPHPYPHWFRISFLFFYCFTTERRRFPISSIGGFRFYAILFFSSSLTVHHKNNRHVINK